MHTDIRQVLEDLQLDLDEQSRLVAVDATLTQALRNAIEALRKAQARIDSVIYADDQEPDHDDTVRCCPDCERPNQFGEICPDCQRERETGHAENRL